MDRRLHIGVLGAAGIARVAVVPAILSSRNATVVAVASRNPAKADWVRQAGIAVVDGYDGLLQRDDIEAVYIPLPNHEHARWTKRAADAGKAVLCEKPLALDTGQAAEVVAYCAKRGVPLLEGFMYRFHPQHARVRAIIESGMIGDPVEVHAHLSVDLMSPTDPENVRFDPAKGGGALLDMGCYTVHIARSVFGAEPTSVVARWAIDPAFGVDTDAAAILDFPDGRTASISCSFRGNGQGFYRIVGRKGVIDVPRGIIPGLGSRVSETIVTIVDADGRRTEETIPSIDHYRLMVEAFADAVLGNHTLPFAPDDPTLNMRVLDAISASAKTGTRVAV
jgi:predicted dehydrogenase